MFSCEMFSCVFISFYSPFGRLYDKPGLYQPKKMYFFENVSAKKISKCTQYEAAFGQRKILKAVAVDLHHT